MRNQNSIVCGPLDWILYLRDNYVTTYFMVVNFVHYLDYKYILLETLNLKIKVLLKNNISMILLSSLILALL